MCPCQHGHKQGLCARKHLCPLPNLALYAAGTVINASEDILDALCAGGTMQVPALVQQDLVALVKTVYALTCSERLPLIRQLAFDMAAKLQGGAADAGRSAVESVRSFWAQEFSERSPAGKRWRALVQAAHLDTPELAAASRGSSPPAAGVAAASASYNYDQAVEELCQQLGELVYPC